MSFSWSRRPFPNDKILARKDTVVRFETPAGRMGLGTANRIAPGRLSIQGMAVLVNDDVRFPDLIELNIRVPKEEADLVQSIQAGVEANQGAPLSDSALKQGVDR